ELRAPGGAVYERGVAFAADGSSIYYVTTDSGQNTLYRLSVLGGVPIKVRDNFGPYFTIAPDNQRVAFVRNDGKTSSVLISNLDGSNERAALTVPASRNLSPLCLSWSPDGSMIALSASPEGDRTVTSIFLLKTAGGEFKQLTAPL